MEITVKGLGVRIFGQTFWVGYLSAFTEAFIYIELKIVLEYHIQNLLVIVSRLPSNYHFQNFGTF